MSAIRSHIQMPKCVLKQFANEKNTLFYYDFESQKIKCGRAASLNTQEGYYSAKTEDYLSREIEAPIGKIIQTVKGLTKNTDTYKLTVDMNPIYSYVYALICRGEQMQHEINESSIFFQLLPEQIQHDFAATNGIRLAKEQGQLYSWLATFTINESAIPFVLPLQGFYSFSFNCSSCINIPITPWHAITLIDEKDKENFIANNIVNLLPLTENKHAQMLNVMAFKTEREHNRKCVISNQREELERICTIIGNE